MRKYNCVRLKELRLEKGLSQKKLAELLGCSVYKLNKWEKCLASPQLYELTLLTYYLDARLNYITGKSKIRKVNNVEYSAHSNINKYIIFK